MTTNPILTPKDGFMLTKTVLNPKWHVIEAKVLRKRESAALRACLRTPKDDKTRKRIYYTNVHKWTTEFTNYKTGEVLTSTDAGRSYGRLLSGVNQFHNETKLLFKEKKSQFSLLRLLTVPLALTYEVLLMLIVSALSVIVYLFLALYGWQKFLKRVISIIISPLLHLVLYAVHILTGYVQIRYMMELLTSVL